MNTIGTYLLELADRTGGSFSVFRCRGGDWIAMFEGGSSVVKGYGPSAYDAVADVERKARTHERKK